MEVDVTKQNITINKLVSSKKEIVTIEGDMIIPDVKPDILNTIDTIGNVCIYKKEVLDGKVRFDGSVNLNIIYLADAENDFTRGVTNSLDFTQIIDVDNCRTGMELRNNINIKEIECKVLNGRKINIKVILEIEIYIYSNEEISILKQINNVEGIQTLNSNMLINNLVGTGCCKSLAKDTLCLKEDDNLAEILKTEVKLINSEMKVSYNKILLKADACVKIMYLTENGDIETISSNIPVMGFIDMPNVSENNILNCQYEIKNILIKPNSSEQHSIYVEIEFEICCDAVDCVDVELIQDMYCPTGELQFKPKEVNTMMNKYVDKNICNIKETISVSEISSNKIYDVEVMPNINNINILNGRVVYEGEVKLNFIFSSDISNGIDTKRYTIPFTFNIDNEQVNSNKIINTKINCIDDEFVVASDGMIDCRINLEFEIEMYDNANINIIDEIKMLEEVNNENPSMVIYIVKDGDTIWNIAKKYKTTMQDIINVNNLEHPDYLSIGQKLFIPRYNKNRIA